ncbi:medium-wave-sensitive opsin 1 [Hydra vulgaris]|uniref:Opsin n=1 Tax=Hydra vulgaris TaxID=6087 RepID=A0A857GWT5_HYDVU|nr:medium-wave-sensitive opsin 1-like [Hydra vulgaris]XP_047126525.1 medium-wave-sensitive opsin 1-like [Hydra vulgaris]QHF16572.1 opsin [Hydra vulgaris]
MALVSIIVLLSFFCGLSFVLNATVIFVVLSKSSIDARETILMSLAVCDGLQSIIGFPNEIYGYVNKDNPFKSESLCKTSGFVVMCLAITAISHLVSLCIYRYAAIVYPMETQVFVTSPIKVTLYLVLPNWIYGLFWSITPFLGWNEIVREKQDTYRCSINLYPNDQIKQSYLYALTIFCYFLPLSIIIYCIIKVHLELRCMLKLGKQISGADASITKATYKLEKEHFISVFLIVVSFFTVWTPYFICVCFLVYGRSLPSGFLTYCALFAKSSTIINPIVYCIVYKEFRQTAISKVRKLLRRPAVAPMLVSQLSTAAAPTLALSGL